MINAMKRHNQSQSAEPSQPTPLAYDVEQLLTMLPIGKTVLYEEARSGRLKSFRLRPGGKLLFLPDDVRQFIDHLAAEAAAS